MRPTVVLIIAPLATGLASCSVLDRFQEPARPGVVQSGQLEAIHAAAISSDQAVFWVSSNGCTQKADLTPVVSRQGEDSVITLRRLKEDRCGDARPEGVEVRWSFEELGLEPGARVSVENPYQLPSG